MGKIRNSELGYGNGNMSQTSINQSNYDKKINDLTRSLILKNKIHPHNLPIKDKPNSIIEQYDDDGKLIRRRYYDENGNAYQDIDYTDHGRPDRHKVPHTHKIINDNESIYRKKGVKPYGYEEIHGNNQKRVWYILQL